MWRTRRLFAGTALGAAACSLALMALALPGCGSSKPPPRARDVTPVMRDVPPVLRNTIGAQATFTGIDPVLVTGYGFVVGLKGTGGKPLPPDVAGTMERQMALNEVSRSNPLQDTALEGPDREGLAPAELLRHPDTAVVVAYARIPPGLPEGATFDVFVQAVNADSLEGGRLWSTDLQIGPSDPFGGYRARGIGIARGALFTNPFIEPGGTGGESQITTARILDGGIVTQPLKMEVVLDNASHLRARAITQAINTRFPHGPSDRGPTARGRSDSGVALTVPARYRSNPGDFVKMVQHMPIDVSIPEEEHARRFADALRNEPGLSEQLHWAIRSLGPKAYNELRKLYDYPELRVRMAALRAGAALEDPLAVDPLVELAVDGEIPARRQEAVRMLGKAALGIRGDMALRRLLDDPDISLRVTAYESLAKRAERQQMERLAAGRASRENQLAAGGSNMSFAEMELLARLSLSGSSTQGIRRRLTARKFLLDEVPSSEPLIYVTQQNEPRMAIFGGDLRLRSPMFVSVWSDRLMLACDSIGDPVRVFYRDHNSRQVQTHEVGDSVVELIELLAHNPTPEDPRPGLGLSYAEVIGVLYAAWSQDAIEAEFTTEQDRLIAELIEASRAGVVQDRPERPGEDAEWPFPVPSVKDIMERREREPFTPQIVPLEPAPGSPRATGGN